MNMSSNTTNDNTKFILNILKSKKYSKHYPIKIYTVKNGLIDRIIENKM